jgi:hypothetical protein
MRLKIYVVLAFVSVCVQAVTTMPATRIHGRIRATGISLRNRMRFTAIPQATRLMAIPPTTRPTATNPRTISRPHLSDWGSDISVAAGMAGSVGTNGTSIKNTASNRGVGLIRLQPL